MFVWQTVSDVFVHLTPVGVQIFLCLMLATD